MKSTVLTEIEYAESDGKPMAETPVHMLVMWNTIQTLIDWFADDPKVYVWGNMMLYYVKGDPKKTVAPDVFVVKGIDKHKERRVFKTWEEKNPKLVIEVTSGKTRKQDLGSKKDRYQNELKVPEYFLFDPMGEWIKSKLRGFRLKDDGEYAEIEPVAGRLPSKVLGLHLEAVGDELRLWDPKAQKYLLTPDEEKVRLQRKVAADAVEIERLRREVEALKQQNKKRNGHP